MCTNNQFFLACYLGATVVKFVEMIKSFIHGIQLLQCANYAPQFIIDYADLNATIAVRNVWGYSKDNQTIQKASQKMKMTTLTVTNCLKFNFLPCNKRLSACIFCKKKAAIKFVPICIINYSNRYTRVYIYNIYIYRKLSIILIFDFFSTYF